MAILHKGEQERQEKGEVEKKIKQQAVTGVNNGKGILKKRRGDNGYSSKISTFGFLEKLTVTNFEPGNII